MQPKQQEQRTRINHYIRVPKVKVIAEDGSFIGEMDTRDALRLAQEQNVDLVEVNAKSYPPLAQLIQYGKWKYENKKKDAETRKKQKMPELKLLAFHPTTELFDLDRQIKQAKDFLADGHRVSFTCKMRGREASHPEVASEKLEYIVAGLSDTTSEHTPIAIEGRNMTTIISPRKSK